MAPAEEGKISDAIKKIAAEQAERLSPLEAAHVQVVLQEAIGKLSLLGLLNNDPKAYAETHMQGGNEEVLTMLQGKAALEARFEELVTAQPALRHLTNKNKLKRNQDELTETSASIRTATMQLCRTLKDNPNIADNMNKIGAERLKLQQLLFRSMQAMQEEGMALPMIEAVLAQEHAANEVAELLESEKQLQAALRQVKLDIKEEARSHDEWLRLNTLALARKKLQLRELQLQLAVDGKYNERDLFAGNDCSGRMQRTTVGDLAHQLHEAEKAIQMETEVFSGRSAYLQRIIEQMTADQETWSLKVETEAAAKHKSVDRLRNALQKDATLLEETKMRLQDENEFKGSRAEQARRAKEMGLVEDLDHERLTRAATKVQSFWRGFKARMDAAKAGKGGKAKGGKKK